MSQVDSLIASYLVARGYAASTKAAELDGTALSTASFSDSLPPDDFAVCLSRMPCDASLLHAEIVQYVALRDHLSPQDAAAFDRLTAPVLHELISQLSEGELCQLQQLNLALPLQNSTSASSLCGAVPAPVACLLRSFADKARHAPLWQRALNGVSEHCRRASRDATDSITIEDDDATPPRTAVSTRPAPAFRCRFYQLPTASRRCHAAAVDCTGAYVAGAFDDSTVRVWPVHPSAPPLPTAGKAHRRLHDDAILPRLGVVQQPEEEDGTAAGCLLLRGHGGPVYDCQFVPNGGAPAKYLLSASGDHGILLFDLCSHGAAAVAYGGHTNAVWRLDVATNQQLFVSASLDGRAHLYDFSRVSPVRALVANPARGVDCALIHPSLQHAVTADLDGVRLWDLRSAATVRLLHGFEGAVEAITLDSDGRRVIVAAEDRKLRVWDLAAGELVAPPLADGWHDAPVTTLRLVGGSLVSADLSGAVQRRAYDNGVVGGDAPQQRKTASSAGVLDCTFVDSLDQFVCVCAGALLMH